MIPQTAETGFRRMLSMMLHRLVAAATIAIFVARATVAQNLPSQPDERLTPGAVASTDSAEVCGLVDGESYSRRYRIWRDKAGTLANTDCHGACIGSWKMMIEFRFALAATTAICEIIGRNH
jgi:hypothetical protein